MRRGIRNKRRAQIQMGETIAVLFIFFILLGFGMIYYVKVRSFSIVRDIGIAIDQNAIEVAERALFMPEIQCSRKNVVYENCVDRFKLDAVAAMVEGGDANLDDYFFSLFSFSKITVVQIYPAGTTSDPSPSWVLYNRPPPEIMGIINITMPVSIHDPIGDLHGHADGTGWTGYGILTVEFYRKR